MNKYKTIARQIYTYFYQFQMFCKKKCCFSFFFLQNHPKNPKLSLFHHMKVSNFHNYCCFFSKLKFFRNSLLEKCCNFTFQYRSKTMHMNFYRTRFLLLTIFLIAAGFLSAQVTANSDYLSRQNPEGKTYTIFHTLYRAEEQPVIATLLILHGMQEHSGRYDTLAHYFAKQGFAVLTYDHIGHGRTAKTEAEQGFFQLKKPVEQLVADAGTMASMLHSQYPHLPHFILGHSMGSFITRSYLQESSTLFEGAVISGTGGKIAGVGLLKSYLALQNRISPEKRSQFVNNTFGKSNNKRFRKEPGASSTSWLSLSEANRIAFDADSLNGIPFSNNGFYTLISVNKRATARHWAKNIERDFPMLFVSGANDPIGNFSKGILQTTSDLEKQGFTDITTLLYPDKRHEILNEEIKEEVFEDILKWLKKLAN